MHGLGPRIRSLRLSRGETQPDLARALGQNVGTISRWERDEVDPHVKQLVALAEHYGCRVDYLLLGSPGDEPRLPGFDEFLATPWGRRAEERGWTRALLALALRFPKPPSLQLYASLVSAMEIEDAGLGVPAAPAPKK